MSGMNFYRILLSSVLAVLFVSCSESEEIKEPLPNEYTIDNEVFEINTNMFWTDAGTAGESDQIRLMEPLTGTSLFDLMLISPVAGPDVLEGTYVYSRTGDIGTYNLVFVHATDGNESFAWFTNGDNGSVLEIEKAGKQGGQEIYRIVISDFNLNYGFWDYLAGKWISQGQKKFSLSYQGPVLEP